MSRHLLRFSLFAGLCLLLANPAHAQFWRKWIREEEPRRSKTIAHPASMRTDVKPADNAPASPAPQRRKKEEKKKEKELVLKDRYRIDVLAQMYLPELVAGGKPVYKSHIPDKVLPALNFYQGIRLAADTLNTIGYQLDVYFHDIADPANSVANLFSKKKLDSSDLIIGAVPSAQVAALADFARNHKINFVSALSPYDANVSDNLYFHLLQPTLFRHCEALREAIVRKARKERVLVYHRSTNSLDEQAYRLMTEDDPFNYETVNCNQLPGVDTLRELLDSTGLNYVVIPVMEPSYARELLHQLHSKFPTYVIEVYGMPSWKGLDVLRKEGSLENLGITFTAPFFFDPSTSAGQGFTDAFNEKFGGKPGELAFRGYETLYWYAYLLKRYGVSFSEHYGDSFAAPFTRFDIRLQRDANNKPEYYENAHVYRYRYQGGSFSVEQ